MKTMVPMFATLLLEEMNTQPLAWIEYLMNLW